jgi:hypothetical protein
LNDFYPGGIKQAKLGAKKDEICKGLLNNEIKYAGKDF